VNIVVKEGTTGIYAIVNMINGKKYIGQAHDIKKRNNDELTALKNNRFFNDHLQHAFNKYVEKNFIFIFIEECSEEKLNEREKYHVSAAGYPDHGLCYNLREGGEAGGKPHPETCKKISESRMGQEPWNKNKKCPQLSAAKSGKKNPMAGVEPWNKGIEWTEMMGENNPNYGGLSEEHIEKLKGPRPSMQGKNNTKAELTDSKVRMIRVMLRSDIKTQEQIGKLFGVGQAAISRIKLGKGWTHVKDRGISNDKKIKGD
jgi:group I intron endonuclease